MNCSINCLAIGMFPTILAYLDPGTGSYIFQIMIAALFGALVALKTFWVKIIELFAKIFKH